MPMPILKTSNAVTHWKQSICELLPGPAWETMSSEASLWGVWLAQFMKGPTAQGWMWRKHPQSHTQTWTDHVRLSYCSLTGSFKAPGAWGSRMLFSVYPVYWRAQVKTWHPQWHPQPFNLSVEVESENLRQLGARCQGTIRDPGSTLGAAISTRRSLRKGSVGTAENGAGPEKQLGVVLMIENA